MTELNLQNFSSYAKIKESVDLLQEKIRLDAKAGKQSTFDDVKKVRGNKQDTDLVLSVAQAILVANKNDSGREEYALQQICEALDVTADEYCIA